jgi:hypothetical protein
MNILIVSKSFYPRISPRSFRATELAKEFSRQGHNVTVIAHTSQYDFSDFKKKYNINIKDFDNGRWKDIKKSNLVTRGFRFILKYFFLFPEIQAIPLLRNILVKEKGFDLLISIAYPYPIHWAVALAINKNRDLTKAWIADCGDPFMGNKEQIFKHPFYFHFVERWFCEKPDFITVPISNAIKAYPKKCRNKIKVIPQGFELNRFKNNKNSFVSNGVVKFAYAGSLSKGHRDPRKFLEYLSSLNQVDFKFIIYTNNASVVNEYKKSLNNKLEIRSYIPRNELLDVLSSMDFLVNIENSYGVQSPSKLIDYTISNRPILSINPDAELNKKVINQFLIREYKNQVEIKNIEQYNIKNVANDFIKLLSKIETKNRVSKRLSI